MAVIGNTLIAIERNHLRSVFCKTMVIKSQKIVTEV